MYKAHVHVNDFRLYCIDNVWALSTEKYGLCIDLFDSWTYDIKHM
jgi:hypothetical protein